MSAELNFFTDSNLFFPKDPISWATDSGAFGLADASMPASVFPSVRAGANGVTYLLTEVSR